MRSADTPQFTCTSSDLTVSPGVWVPSGRSGPRAGLFVVEVGVFFDVQAVVEVGCSGVGPGTQVSQLLGGEAVVVAGLVVLPLGADEVVAQFVEVELGAGVAAAEGFEIVRGAVPGGCVDVDEVADSASVGQGPGFGSDHVFEEEDRSVLGGGRRSPESLFEDVDLALLTGSGH